MHRIAPRISPTLATAKGFPVYLLASGMSSWCHAPVFKDSRAVNSSACCSIRSASLFSIRPRRSPDVLKPQLVFIAFLAASTAKSTSFLEPPATDVMSLPVAAMIVETLKHYMSLKDSLPGLTTLRIVRKPACDWLATYSILPPSTGSTNLPSMKRPVFNETLPLYKGVSNLWSKVVVIMQAEKGVTREWE